MSVQKKLRRLFTLRGLSQASWTAYSSAVGLVSKQQDNDYIVEGAKVGAVSPVRAAELLRVIKACPRRALTMNDYAPGYRYNAAIEEVVDKLNESFVSYDLRGAPLKAIKGLCEEIDADIRLCLGSRWKVVAAKAARTHPDSEQIGRNTWHSDHFPPGLHKILVYLTPPGSETGTTEVKLKTGAIKKVDGPAGTYVLFNPTTLSHRGVSPKQGERISIDLTVVPSFLSGLDPVYPGQNGAYPVFPWGKRGLTIKS